MNSPLTILNWSFLLALMLTAGISEAAVLPKYLVLFKDKGESVYTIAQPKAYLSDKAIARRIKQNIQINETDLPVNASYLNQVTATGAKISLVTKWLNGAIVEADENQLNAIRDLPFFKSVVRERPINSKRYGDYARTMRNNEKFETSEEYETGAMTQQLELLGIQEFFKENIAGQGLSIAVLDAGFLRVNQIPYFSSLFEENRIIDSWDFMRANSDVFVSHVHGTQVLSTLAAYQPATLIGVAPKASYALYRTENAESEIPLEEITWLCAAERADSTGVDIITSSLGYNYFDNPEDSYSYGDMDGHTSIISAAARWAIRKGILVVNSAGNEGNNGWKYLVTPADVDSVITVGATNYLLQKAGFSSIGPNAGGIIKPDVAAVGQGVVLGSTSINGGISTGNGTSFSAPQIAGFAALLWQKYPQLTVMQVAELIRKSGHQAQNPDNELGYGVPDYTSAMYVYEQEYLITGVDNSYKQNWVIYPNPVENELFVKGMRKYILEPDPVIFQLKDINGRPIDVISEPKGDDIAIRIGMLPSGLYFLHIDNKSKGMIVLKVIKQ
jgi:serine protease AprX